MANQGRVTCIGGAFVQQGFQASGRTAQVFHSANHENEYLFDKRGTKARGEPTARYAIA